MLRICMDPELLAELIGLPKNYALRAVEWREERAQYVFYACDRYSDGDIIVDLDPPTYTWKSNTKMRIPRGA